jgi:multicomponent Na+:H+ antiporter subunit E
MQERGHASQSWRAAFGMLPILLLLWYALSGGRGWLFGAAAAIVVVIVGRWLVPAPPLRLSPTGVAAFAGYFVWRSLLGGVDVAWRALHPSLPLAITEVWYPTRELRSEARTLFIGTMSLLPGTLACDLVDEHVRVHSIAGDPREELAWLERRVRSVFRDPALPAGR